MLLEQAARCFVSFHAAPMHRQQQPRDMPLAGPLQPPPPDLLTPSRRQHALYMVLAGFRFLSCGQRRLAARAYSSALRVYEGRGWTHIEGHVCSALARNYAALGLADLSERAAAARAPARPFPGSAALTPALSPRQVAFFLRLLRNGAQPSERLAGCLRELRSLVAKQPRAERFEALPLPRFRNESIAVLLNDNGAVGGVAEAADDETTTLSASHPLWKPLIEPLLPPSEVALGNWLTGPRAAAASAAALPCAVVGEWVQLAISVENPTQLSLELSEVRLVCTLSGTEGAEGGAGGGAGGGADGPLELESVGLVLEPGQTARLRLGVRPNTEGEPRLSAEQPDTSATRPRHVRDASHR